MPHECITYDGNDPYLKPKQVIKKINLETGESTEYVVGTINESGGVCGCCCNVSPYALDNQEFEKKEFGEEPTFKVELVERLYSKSEIIEMLESCNGNSSDFVELLDKEKIVPEKIEILEGHIYE